MRTTATPTHRIARKNLTGRLRTAIFFGDTNIERYTLNKTILIVEDEAIIAMSEKRALENYGYTVHTAKNGKTAVEMNMLSPVIDLILMDMALGEGIDGVETARIILESYDIPIVFLSNHPELLIMEKTQEVRSYGYVMKSSSTVILDAAIKMAFKLFEAHKNQR
jgi:CheY-like chemotaxis protein